MVRPGASNQAHASAPAAKTAKLSSHQAQASNQALGVRHRSNVAKANVSAMRRQQQQQQGGRGFLNPKHSNNNTSGGGGNQMALKRDPSTGRFYRERASSDDNNNHNSEGDGRGPVEGGLAPGAMSGFGRVAQPNFGGGFGNSVRPVGFGLGGGGGGAYYPSNIGSHCGI